MSSPGKMHPVLITLFFLSCIFYSIPKGYAASPEQDVVILPSTVSQEYIIGSGDILEISVWKEEDLSKTYAVRIDGRISVPLLGDIVVSQKTISQLTKHLEEKFQDVITSPTVSIILIESRSRRYYVIGQIQQSGEFNIDQPITALQAIAKSGGFREWAKTDKIKIVRKQGNKHEIIKFNYKALAEEGDLEQDQYLQAGDTIIIP